MQQKTAVGPLLDLAGVSQRPQRRKFGVVPIELRRRQDDDIEILGERLARAGDRSDLPRSRLEALSARCIEGAQVVDDDSRQSAFPVQAMRLGDHGVRRSRPPQEKPAQDAVMIGRRKLRRRDRIGVAVSKAADKISTVERREHLQGELGFGHLARGDEDLRLVIRSQDRRSEL